jgi:hypothetical protein
MSHRSFLRYVGGACLGAGCVDAVGSLSVTDEAPSRPVARRAAPALTIVDATLARDAEYVAWQTREFTDVLASIAALRRGRERRAREPAA